MKEFGIILRELRIEKGLSALALGKIIDVSDATIIRWENNQNSPSIDILVPLVKFFGVSAGYLLGLEEF